MVLMAHVGPDFTSHSFSCIRRLLINEIKAQSGNGYETYKACLSKLINVLSDIDAETLGQKLEVFL